MKVKSCKYKIANILLFINTNNNEIFAFIAVLVFKLMSRKIFVYKQKRQYKLLKSRLLFKEIADFTGKLLENYKLLECKVFRVLLKHVSDHLSVLFELNDCTFSKGYSQEKSPHK